MGIHLPLVKFSTTLSTIFTSIIIFIPQFCFLYSFFRTTDWRKIRVRKEYGGLRIHAWVSTTTILSIQIWINISHRPHFFRIISTRFFTIWTNQIHRVGLIRINTTHTLNLMMTIISKIIFTLHRVNRNSPPLSQIFNHIVHNFHNFHNIHSPILLSILLF